MSNYYLCPHCAHYDGQSVVAGGYVYCTAGCNGYKLRQTRVMYDHHGRDGKRYDEPTDVCADFERK